MHSLVTAFESLDDLLGWTLGQGYLQEEVEEIKERGALPTLRAYWRDNPNDST